MENKAVPRKQKRFYGVIPALITPFTKKGEIDGKGLDNLLSFLIEQGVTGIFALSSTGEYHNLNRQHKEQVINIVVDKVKGRMPVYVNATALNVNEAVKNGEQVKEFGGDVAVYTPPHYFKYSQENIYEFYRTIADEVPVPIMFYPHKAVKNTLELETLYKLFYHPNVVGMKDTMVDMKRFMSIVLKVKDREDFSVLQGSEAIFGISTAVGGDGGVLALANIAPKLFLDLYDAAVQGDLKACMQLQEKVNSLFKLLSITGDYTSSFTHFLSGLLAGLTVLGISKSYPSQFGKPISTGTIVQAEQILKEADLI